MEFTVVYAVVWRVEGSVRGNGVQTVLLWSLAKMENVI
jgi:hypothetical protein